MEKVHEDDWKDIFEILALIDFHMHPYFWEKDDNVKMKEKYYNLWGEDLYRKVIALHEADRKAH